MAQQPMAIQQPLSGGPSIRGLAGSIVVSGVLPFIAYQVLTGRGVDSFHALVWTAVFPIAGVAWSWIRTRHLDGIGSISLIFIVLGLATSLISGDARFFLIKESFLTGLFGAVCLGSLLLPRPLMFYLGRQFASGGDPARAAYFTSLWQYEQFRHSQRLITAVWGLGFVAEALVRVALTFVLAIPVFLVVSPIIAYGTTLALIAWTMTYARRAAKRGEEARVAQAATAQRTEAKQIR